MADCPPDTCEATSNGYSCIWLSYGMLFVIYVKSILMSFILFTKIHKADIKITLYGNIFPFYLTMLGFICRFACELISGFQYHHPCHRFVNQEKCATERL